MTEKYTKMDAAVRQSLQGFILFIFMILAFLGNPNPAFADYFMGPAASGTGGAGRAAILGAESHYLNPAAIGLEESYQLGYLYRFDDHPDDRSQLEHSFVALDSYGEVMVPASVSYTNVEKRNAGRRVKEHDYLLSIGGRVLERLSFGVMTRYWQQKPDNGPEDSAFQLGFGTLWAPLEWMQFGFVSYNILDSQHNSVIRPEWAIATQLAYEDLFRFRADALFPSKDNPDRKGILMAGAETLFSNGIRARFGGRWDDIEKKTFATAGIGFEGPKLSGQYSYEQDTRRHEHFRQTFDLRLVF